MTEKDGVRERRRVIRVQREKKKPYETHAQYRLRDGMESSPTFLFGIEFTIFKDKITLY